MSAPQFDVNGLEIETFDAIYQRLATGLREIYGNDINLELDSPDGQRLGILTQQILDMQTFALQLYNQMDADFASGEWLNKLIKFAGIFRKPAIRSQVDVNITVAADLTLPSGYIVRDELGQRWLTVGDTALLSGVNAVTLVAENFGAIAAAPNTVNAPETVVIGVTAVNNPLAAVAGVDEESDERLRVRRDTSTQNPSYSITGGLNAKLNNLPQVSDAVVYDNPNPTTDVVRAIPPNTIWAVIEGGSVDDITETLAKQRSGGCGMKGTVTSTYIETVTRPDGSTFTIAHPVKFDRPTTVNLRVRLTATRTDSLSPIDLALMKSKLSAVVFRIGDSVKASQLYAPAYTTGDNFVLSLLEISLDGITWVSSTLFAGYAGKFDIVDANVTITEVI